MTETFYEKTETKMRKKLKQQFKTKSISQIKKERQIRDLRQIELICKSFPSSSSSSSSSSTLSSEEQLDTDKDRFIQLYLIFNSVTPEVFFEDYLFPSCNDNIIIFNWFRLQAQKKKNLILSTSRSAAARSNALECFKILFKKINQNSFNRINDASCCADTAAQYGSIDILRYLFSQFKDDIQNIHIHPGSKCAAIRNGFIDTIKCLHEHDKLDHVHSFFFNDACSSGNLEMIQYLISIHASDINNICFYSAVRHGHLHVLKFFYPHLIVADCYTQNSLIFYACEYNQFIILKYLFSIGIQYNDDQPIKVACEYASRDIIRLFHDNGFVFRECHYNIAMISMNVDTAEFIFSLLYPEIKD